MKTLIEIFRIIYALVAGFLAVLAVSVFVLLILNKNRDVSGIFVSVLVAIFALYLGYQVYRAVRRRGVLNFVTAVIASPDLDNLASSDRRVREINVREFVNSVNHKKSFFKGGHIRIWGDWQGRQLERSHKLKSAQYIDGEKLLEIVFEDNSQVYIWNPQKIIESDTYLKILKADNIRWRWKSTKLEDFFYDYRMENGKILTWTNSNYKGDEVDTLQGEPAILMRK